LSVHDVLRKAIETRHCVRIMASGFAREVCPLALGYKGTRQKVLTFQYRGGSVSGLAPGGAWRCFFLDEISAAEPIDEAFQVGQYPVAKIEASLDYVVCGIGARTRTYRHLARR
jgi:hypothetical protein